MIHTDLALQFGKVLLLLALIAELLRGWLVWL